MSQLVSFTLDRDVGVLTLSRPAAGNAIDPVVVADFAAAVDAAVAAPARAFLIRAEGANFSVGADLRSLAAAGGDLPARLAAMADGTHRAQAKLAAKGPPIVSAVRGVAIGGGLGLALTADFLVMAQGSRLSTGYTRLGFSPDAGVSYFLTRALGPRRARALLIDSRFLDAQQALELGLADRVVPDEALDEAAAALAQELAQGPTAAYAAIRRQTDAAFANDFAAHLDAEARSLVALAGGKDTAANLAAMLNKQKPRFSG